MRGKITVTLGRSYVSTLTGEPDYKDLSENQKDEVCDALWDELELDDAIPGQGYGLQTTETGFTVDGDLDRVDWTAFRGVMERSSDYEYEIDY